MCQITFLILGYRNQESQQSLCVLETEKEIEKKKKKPTEFQVILSMY